MENYTPIFTIIPEVSSLTLEELRASKEALQVASTVERIKDGGE